VHRSVTPIEHHSAPIGGFSKVDLGHHVVFLALELADRGSSTVGQLDHGYGAFPGLMPRRQPSAALGRRILADYFRFADNPGAFSFCLSPESQAKIAK
jgi:hypothetical protein